MPLRLILDDMYPPAAALRLRERGVDAIAVKQVLELLGLEDPDLVAAATADRRVLVTENVADYAVLARERHVGIVFCHPKRFPRDSHRVDRLVDALAAFGKAPPPGMGEQAVVWWLVPLDAQDSGVSGSPSL